MKQFLYFQFICSLLAFFQSTLTSENYYQPSIRIPLCKRDRCTLGTIQIHKAFKMPRSSSGHSRNFFNERQSQLSHPDKTLSSFAVMGHKIPLKKINT